MCLVMILEQKGSMKSEKNEKSVTICLVIFSLIIFYIDIRKICPSPSGDSPGRCPVPNSTVAW